MRYADEYRDGRTARALSETLSAEVRSGRHYNIMEFCGGHTHTIARHGIEDLLPPNIRMIHGPGCPVCVLPTGRIDMAIALAREPGVILCTYGDVLRVPGSGRGSLMGARAMGADVRMVYSVLDALKTAQDNPDRVVVFFAIGFETTTPPTAAALKQAKGLDNFTVFCNHVLTPPAIHAILGEPDSDIQAVIGPGHVSAITGTAVYEPLAAAYRRPIVVAGFEPLDLMLAVLMSVRQINAGRFEVENEYGRVVTREGNRKAQDLVDEVLEVRPSFTWRGFGELPQSGLGLRAEFAAFDAERRFNVSSPSPSLGENKACECPSVVRGRKRPSECLLFGTVCTPETPVGACMVSSEGACAAHWQYGRFRDSSGESSS